MASNWIDLHDDELTASIVKTVLSPIEDDLWVATACLDRLLDDVDVERELLNLGIARTERAVQAAKDACITSARDVSQKDDEPEESSSSSRDKLDRTTKRHHFLRSYFVAHPEDAQLCRVRSALLNRLARLEMYLGVSELLDEVDKDTEEEDWEDDPWGAAAPPIDNKSVLWNTPSRTRPPMPLPLSLFLTSHPSLLCTSLASQMQFDALLYLLSRSPQMRPYRFAVLQSIPLFADPQSYRDLLPGIDQNTGRELPSRWVEESSGGEWCQQLDVRLALEDSLRGQENLKVEEDLEEPIMLCSQENAQPDLLSGSDILLWYKKRVDDVLLSTAMVDTALGLVQHGVSLGVSGLDEVGEDLTLISRLIYDAPGTTRKEDQPISLVEWRSLSPGEILQKYLHDSCPETIVVDIRNLVMPYLFVLESRSERAGHPDPTLLKRHLYEYILQTPLDLLVPIFEASKPTLLPSQRIIADDEDLARLALSCLYGSETVDSWSDMSRIFECLPAWTFNVGDHADGGEADTTVDALSAFLAPSASRPHCSPADLHAFFKPLPARSLSRALDILDIHLESGEVVARWDAPVPLRWLLQSSRNVEQQRILATKMVRQSSHSFESEDDWLSLLEDMLKVARPEGEDIATNSAFGALSKDDIRKIFFSGLLSAGKFAVAKALVMPRHGEALLDSSTVEFLCLECSREFYDNASSGNYNFGGMKCAYECLSVPVPSRAVQREREFIEATSRVSSFNVMSRPGVPLLPIEIRLAKDKLSIISRVLSGNDSAYKHTEVILELVRKLGYRDDILAEVKTLTMISDTALQTEDFEVAFQACDRMADTVKRYKASIPAYFEDHKLAEAIEVCWVACFQLGRHPEADDIEKRMVFLGRALELCPPDKIADILTSWRGVEDEDIDRRSSGVEDNRSGTSNRDRRKHQTRGRTATLASKLQGIQLHSPSLPSAPDAAAMASHAFNRVAASLPFSLAGRERSSSQPRDGSQRRAGSPDVQAQARHALQRGIGWLIGAEEDEM